MGGKTFSVLMHAFNNDVDAILHADESTLRKVRGIGAKTAALIQQVDVAAVHQRIKQWIQADIKILTRELYPPRLSPLDDAPPLLFLRGQLPNLPYTVAIVGTRQADDISRTRAQKLAEQVAQKGGLVVSGLAKGIDTAAHMGALMAYDGRTVAVLGNGICTPYPSENSHLADSILKQGGGLLCECAPDAPPSAPALVARNRIITGLADALVVVQSSINGGAMHAARFATAQGRPVYTFDHPATGNQALLAQGIRCLDDSFTGI
jgi:DNA processing protein